MAQGRPHPSALRAGFWGDGGIERIHASTGGWPHLVQRVAETVVDLLKYDQRTEANAEILERALATD